MKQIALINPENVLEAETSAYQVREAARAIVFDENKNVALLHATKYNYYKLPGGGIEEGESKVEALKRECLEEIGCNVEIISEIGLILEYRKKYNLKQTSYCYLARLVGEKGIPQLMDDEKEEGFQTVWIPIEEAVQKIKNCPLNAYESKYITSRDSLFIQEASKIL